MKQLYEGEEFDPEGSLMKMTIWNPIEEDMVVGLYHVMSYLLTYELRTPVCLLCTCILCCEN